MKLIERVARALFANDDKWAKASWSAAPDRIKAMFRSDAKAAIRAMLDGVESNLSAVQYDPAPYTAMKHRIAAMRKEALGDE